MGGFKCYILQISQDRLVFGTEVAQKVHDTYWVIDCCTFHPQTQNYYEEVDKPLCNLCATAKMFGSYS